MKNAIRFASVAAMSLILVPRLFAAEPAAPAMGDYQGQWQVKAVPRELAAQVIPRGDEACQIVFASEFYKGAPPEGRVSAALEGGVFRFDADGWSGTIEGGTIRGTGLRRGKPAAFELKQVERTSPRLGAKPPEGAVVLFDGSGLDHWEGVFRGQIVEEIPWKIVDGALQVASTSGDSPLSVSIRSRIVFRNFQLHLEFRSPLMADATGQQRGNSGVIIEDYNFYEVQILDSYGLEGYYNECGGLYNVARPKVNMCYPPGQWQSYDITFEGPRFDAEGKPARPARITVDHNGTLIHNQTELPDSPGAEKMRRENPDARLPGRITLQNHRSAVEFRNIWMVDLTER